ncbi:MAG: hypothetical protein V1722_02045 [Candidatus Micrarchaeota archaeon]
MSLDFFTNQGAFRKAVTAHGGKVIVLVHPSFNAGQMPDGIFLRTKYGTTQKQFNQYRKVVQRLKHRYKVPLVIMEDNENALQSAQAIASANIFHLKTDLEDSQPTAGWKALHKALRSAKVKTILVAGELSIEHGNIHSTVPRNYSQAVSNYERKLPRQITSTLTGGCAVGAYHAFIEAGHDKVRLIPNAVFPDKPTYELRKPRPGIWKRIVKTLRHKE